MASDRAFVASTILGGLVAIVHAALTWPLLAVLAFFGGGAALAFVGEVVAVHAGWLDHHLGPKLLAVPVYALFGWIAVTYVAFRLALLVVAGWQAVALAALLATGYDVLVDHRGVEQGAWTYTDDLPGPRYRGVPWWNYLGWLGISSATASLALPFL